MNTLFLSVRVLHVLLGALWLGAAVLMSFFVMPAIGAAGPDGAKVLVGLGKRRIPAYIASISGLAVVTGFWLYYRFTDGFNPALSATPGAMVFGAGGVLGLIALILASAVAMKNFKRIIALLEQMEKTEASGRPALMAQIAPLRQKATTGARIVAFLLIITIILMALGHYV